MKSLSKTLCLTVFMALALAGGGLMPLLAPTQAVAQDDDKKRKPKTKRAESLDKATFETLTEAQLKISPEEEGVQPDYRAAERILRELLNDENLKPYGRALAWQTMGYSRAEQENYDSAIEAFEKALALEALPPGNQNMLKYNVGQLYVAVERYRDAVRTLKEWFDNPDNQNPPANAYILLGSAYAQLEQYRNAITPIKTAIEKSIDERKQARQNLEEARASGDEEAITAAKDRFDSARGPQESWYQLLLSMHLELEQYDEADQLLEFLVDTYPNSSQIKTYWGQLGAIRSEKGNEKAAFAILELQYIMDMLEKTDEWERFAQLYMYYEVPFIAANILEEGFDKGVIEKNIDNYEMLANAWFNARNYDKAIGPLEIAAEKSDKGELHYRLGQALYEQREMEGAAEALETALQRGGIDNTCNVHLLLGIIRNEVENVDGAVASFKRAARDSNCEKDANRWIKFVEQTQKAREEA